MHYLVRKWGLSFKVLFFTIIIILVKLALHFNNIEPLNSNPLLSSVIGGLTFLIGFILAGTLSDFKESEKLPAEIVSSMENLYEEAAYLKNLNNEFDLDSFKTILVNIADELKEDMGGRKKKAIASVSGLSAVIFKAEKQGIPSVWISRLKSEQAALKKSILRMYQIKQTQFIPAAYAIAEIMVFIIIMILVFLKLEPVYESLAMVSVMTFVYLYMVMLIKDIDDPFDSKDAKSYASVSFSILDSFKKRII